jgi:hypothetical protein
MFDSLLGRLVWFALKTTLRQKYGRDWVRSRALAAGTVAIAVGVGLAVARDRSS